ncbi:MAG: oligosaccharide flippase family protein [Actinomycetota bacterium]|nr:oligosaccharide flippase family protein [Actinomycetota bacterium]
MAEQDESLRSKAVRGGRYLVLREAVGILLRSAGLLVLTRLIGPTQYGLFAGPQLVMLFLVAIAITGSDIFVIRRREELDEAWLHQVFSYLLVSSTTIAAAAIGVALLVGDRVGESGYLLPFVVLMASLPVNVLWIPGRVKLERAFDYRRLATAELGGDVIQYALGVGLALAGAGVWAAVWGFVARQAWLLLAVYVLSGYRPRWVWERARLREILAFGSIQSATAVANRAGDLMIPLVVGAFLGARGVGIAALALRLADTLSFVNRATYRLSIVTLGRTTGDPDMLRRGVETAHPLQVIGVGVPLVGFCIAGTIAVPLFLGESWRALILLFPLVALFQLLQALSTTPQAALIVLGRHRALLYTNLVALALLFGLGWLLVPVLGLAGYGLTKVLALAAQYLSYRALQREIPGGVTYRTGVPWLVALAPPLFVPLVPLQLAPLLLLPAVTVLASRRRRAELRSQVQLLRKKRGSQAPGPAGDSAEKSS